MNFMANRTVKSHASFFKPYLRAGMQVIDCGCGPGTITLGLASLVMPGTVTGVDTESSQVSTAYENASLQKITNIKFLVGNVYELPCAKNSFDAAFSHAMLEHLQEPLKALRELFRVLKPGGILGVRSPDWGGFLVAPSNPELDEAISYYKRLQQHNGGDPYVGRKLKSLLRQSGFIEIKTSASYECYQNPTLIAEYLAMRIEGSETTDKAVEKGWTNPEAIEVMSKALRDWSNHPDALFAQAWCEAIGRKA
jgi:ubiquinone/menaquinone biosynthesis C-methylase UbiE